MRARYLICAKIRIYSLLSLLKKGAKDTFKRPKPAKRGSNVAGVVQAFGERTGKVKFPEKSYGKGVDKSA